MKTAGTRFTRLAQQWLLFFLLICLVRSPEAQAGVTSVKQNTSKSTSPSNSLGQADFAKEALFTGGVSVPMTLAKVGSIEVQLQYGSNVHKQVRSENRVAPSGWIGLGWNLTFASIVGEIAGTADTSDDHYRFMDSEGSSEIVKLPSGEFVMKQYKLWKIKREDSSGVIVGWTITKEDGTVMRFGNYHAGEKRFSLALDSSFATRCQLGFAGIVDNPPSSLYSNATLIPYQWDLSDVQEVGGSHTFVTYQQVSAQLSLGGLSTLQRYTRESHPYKIVDSFGGEVEFVLANLNSDEYYGQSQSFTQNLFESKRLDTLKLKQNGQVYQRIVLVTLASQDILAIGAKRRYLTEVNLLDRSGNSMKLAKYAYCGLAGEAQGANPGALRRVTFRSGGCTEYTYKAQALPLDTLARTSLIDPFMRYGCAVTHPNATGIAGNDFYVMSSSLYRNLKTGQLPDSIKPIQVFRQGPTGWFVDASFPYSSVGFCQAGHDYIVGYFDGRWKLVKRSGEGWIIYDIEDAFASQSIPINANGRSRMGPIGLGSTYFVFKYNLVLPMEYGDYNFSLAAVRLTESGLKVSALGSGYHETHYSPIDNTVYIMHMWADCAENYFVVSSRNTGDVCTTGMVDSHFKWRNGAWVNLMDKRVVQQVSPWYNDNSAVKFPSTVPSHQIGKNFVVCKYPGGYKQVVTYRDSGGVLVMSDSLAELDINTVVVGDFFYGVGYKSSPSCPWVKTWTGAGWSSRSYLSAYFSGEDTLQEASSFSSGNRLVFAGTTSANGLVHILSLTHNGSDWAQPNHLTMNDTCDFPNLGGFTDNAFLLEKRYGSVDEVHCGVRCYTFVGDSLRASMVVPFARAFLQSATPLNWYTQPGRNFVLSFSIMNLCSASDTNHVYTQGWDANGDASFTGTSYDFVLDKKVVIPGTGDSLKTTFAFENGSFDEQVSSGRYNKATVTLPGNSGRSETYFYNDLGPNQAVEFVAAKNYLELDGKPYRTKDFNSNGNVVREANQLWAAEAIDSVRGVYYEELLRDSTLTDGIAKVSTYEYGNPAHLQVTKITELNGPVQRFTKMRYPLDYASTSPGSSSAMVRALDSMKTVNHMVNTVIEKRIIQDSLGTSKVLSAELTQFKGLGSNRILPEMQFALRASAGIPEVNFTASGVVADTFAYDANFALQHSLDLFTPFGQVIQERDANGVASTTKWGYTYAVARAQIKGGRDGECSVLDFEDSTTGDWIPWDWTYPYGSISSSTSHTGQTGWSVPATDYEGVYKVIRGNLLTANTKYTLSAWVKTSSTSPHLLWEVIYHDGQGVRHDDYPGGLYASGSGTWQFLECPLDLNSSKYQTIDTLVIFVLNGDWNNHAACILDDIRFAPSNALVQSSTFDPIMLLQTSTSDPSGLITSTVYDGFGRPIQVKNNQGSTVKEYSYYYSADIHSGAFLASDPNYMREKSYRTATDTITVKSYTDGLGREIQKEVCYGDSDIIVATKYDSLNHPRYAYKPYQVGLGGSMHTYDGNFSGNLSTYYTGLGITLGTTPYSETRYCQDPLSRVSSQGAPGDAFAVGAGHDLRMDYLPDLTNKWNVILTRNEQGDTTRVSKDLFGNTVRSVVRMGTADSLATKFTYDALGNLTTSTPPQEGNFTTSYQYNTLSQVGAKTSPDAGTVFYLYDKNGNGRLTRDAAHTGSGANAVNISASVSPGGQTSGNITLNNRGKLNLTLNAPGYQVVGGIATLQVKTQSGTVLLTLTSVSTPQSASIILPQGTYSYLARSTAITNPATPYTLQCQTQYPFMYAKYDSLNRPIQAGEYEASDASSFTQAQADEPTFPTSSYLLTKTYFYDTCSTDAMAATQRNVKGRLSWTCSYRLGSLALTTFYSYDDMGRVEWIVQKGLGSASKKIAYSYDQQGNLTQKTYTDAYNTLNNHTWWYEYDLAGRMVRVFSGVDYSTRVKEAETACLATGRESQTALGFGPAQTLSFTYNQRDWMKSISSALFWESLGYESVQEIGSTLSVTPQYGGNISWMAYSMAPDTFTVSGSTKTTTVGYGFGYDKAGRLTSANFGYKYSGSWASHDRYKMPQIGYDKNGNIKNLTRYGTTDGTNALSMDNLTYSYVANSNRLDYISDVVSAATFTTDIDNQSSGAYAYDGNGNVKADASRSMALVVYDMMNLPVSEYKTDGTLIQYVYDVNGNRVQKTVGAGSAVWYVGGADGKTEVVYNGSTSNPCYNVFGPSGLIGQVKRSGVALSRQYHLKDHLGTVRETVSPTMIVENFGSDLSQWTTVLGSGFAIESGYLSASSSGSDNVMVNSSSTTFGDGIVTCDVSNPMPLPSFPDVSLVVRYVDTNNFYLIYPCNNRMKIWKKLSGSYSLMADMTLPDGIMMQNTWYHMQITLSGSNIKVSWNGQLVVNWTDPSNPFLSGKVGFRQDNSYHAHWDNFIAYTTSAPTVVAYDDYYPFGQYMDTRSFNAGFSDGRYKYTEKERDGETGYDYFGARYYDARVGRWMSVDPLAEKYSGWSPYCYVLGNPNSLVDRDGKVPGIAIGGVVLGAGEATVLVLGGVAATAAALGSDKTAAVLQGSANWVDQNINKPIIEGIQSGIDWIKDQIGATTVPIDQGAPGAGPMPLDKTESSGPVNGQPPYDQPLPKDAHGNAIPTPGAEGAHTQLGQGTSKSTGKTYPQAREWDANGKKVRDIDFTDHGKPKIHPNPHEHKADPKTGKRLGPTKLGG